MKKLLCMITLFLLLVSLAACEDFTIHINFDGNETTAPSEEALPSQSTEEPETTGTAEATEATEETAAPTDPMQPETEVTQPSETEAAQPPQTDPTTSPTTPTQPPVTLSPAEVLWEKLAGCWTCGSDRFVYFTYNDEGPAFLSGYWDNPVPYNRAPASVTDVADLGGDRYILTLVYPPNEENAADEQDLRPLEYTIALQTDELHKGIVFMETPEGSDFEYYSLAGYSYDDAYDATHNTQYATFAEMQEFWNWLTGYWNSDDGHFIYFDQMDSHTLVFMEGIWDSGTRGEGFFDKALSGSMDLPTEFVIYYPPVSNELDGDLPAEYMRVSVDWMEVETHSRVSVKFGENGVWRWYYFAGTSMEEAYPNK